MKEEFRLRVGKGLFLENFQRELSCLPDDLIGFILGNLSYLDNRAEIGMFMVNDIEENDDGSFTLHYSFDWSAYYGCSDMMPEGDEYGEISFNYENDSLVFEKEVIPERSTYDEL
jgi:hypothetical protein